MRWVWEKLDIDTSPHSGYPNNRNLDLRIEFWFNTPYNRGWMNCGSLDYKDDIWCHGGLRDVNGSTASGTYHVTYGYTSGSWNSNTWSHMNYYQRDYIAFRYMLNYSLAERMKMLIDPNYKPVYK